MTSEYRPVLKFLYSPSAKESILYLNKIYKEQLWSEQLLPFLFYY